MSRLIQLDDSRVGKSITRDYTFVMEKAVGESGVFEGYASTFGNEDSYGDTIVKGAFTAGLKKLKDNNQKLKMLWNHDRQQPIGVFTAASEDKSGLYVKGKLTKGVQKADEVLLLMHDGAIDSMSIGGYVVKELFDNKTGKSELQEIELREISPVTFPANTQARINTVKSIEAFGMMSELEAHLRDVGGFSVKEAKALIAKAKGLVPQRDVAAEAAEILRQAINNLKLTK
jgi:HK97 family phage prohead protease